MTRRAELRASAPGNIGEIKRLSDELDELAQSAEQDFPLDDRQSDALRDDLRERILALHTAEVELHAKMRQSF
jgi:hypothetical protein